MPARKDATRLGKREHWGVIPLDDDLIKWRRVKDEPLMAAGMNGPKGVLDYGFGRNPPKDRAWTRGLYATNTFFDKDGRVSVTRVNYPGRKDLGVAVFAENGSVTLRSLDVWDMKPVW